MNEAGNSGNGQSDMIEDEEIPQVDYADFVSEEHLHEQLDTSLTAIGISPLKLPKLHQHERHSYIKRKTKQIKEKSQQMLCDYAGLPSSSMNVPPDISKETVSEVDMEYLVNALKDKLTVTKSKKEKISLLTLVPNSWTLPKTIEQFGHLGVTEYLVRRSRQLKKDHGMLPNVTPSLGRALSEATKEKVIAFYKDDEVSTILPGKKGL